MGIFRRKLLAAWLASTYGSIVLAFASAINYSKGAIDSSAIFQHFCSSYRIMLLIAGAVTFVFGLIISILTEALVQHSKYSRLYQLFSYVIAVFLFSCIVDSSSDRTKLFLFGIIFAMIGFFVEEFLKNRILNPHLRVFWIILIVPIAILGVSIFAPIWE